jgi:hypothetical protein
MAIEPAFDGRGSCHKLDPVPSRARLVLASCRPGSCRPAKWRRVPDGLPAVPVGFVPNSAQERLMVARGARGIGLQAADLDFVHEW